MSSSNPVSTSLDAVLMGDEDRLQSLMDALPVLISYVDADQRYRLNNKAYEEWFGHARDELKGRRIRDVLGDDAYEVVRDHLNRALAGEKITFEAPAPYKDGGKRYIRATYAPDFGAEGEIRGVFALVEDLTDLNRAEQALQKARAELDDRVRERTRELREANIALKKEVWERIRVARELAESEAHLQSVLDAAIDAMFTFDEHGIIRSFSASAERLFGYEAAEAVGNSIKVLLPSQGDEPDDRFVERLLEAGLKRNNVRSREIIAKQKNGGTFPAELSVGEIKTGGCNHFVGFVRDITGRKLAEHAAHQHRAELARVLRVNTIGEMASALAHELNQPLSAIMSYAQASIALMRSSGHGSEELIGHLENAAAQARRAGEIVRHIRRFIRKEEPTRCWVDMNEIVREAVTFIQPEASHQNIRIRVALGRKLPMVSVERIAIEQVIMNLFHNSVEAIRKSESLRRDVTIATGLHEIGMVRVTVRDTGPGLSEELGEQIFEPFTTTKWNGLGLGLSICRSIVREHGGELWATTHRDGGAVFEFSLPAAPEGYGDEH